MEEKKKEPMDWRFAISHATSYNGTAMIIYAITATYFSVYMTDSIGLAAGTASIIMFISTLWDAINDPIMGVIVDRTKSRWGRYRPYFIAAPILLTIFGTLIWLNPNFSDTGKFWFVLITYIGFGMTQTMYTMPHMAILPAHVKEDSNRNIIISMGATLTSIAYAIGTSFTLNIKTALENWLGVSNGYIPMMLILGFLSAIAFWSLFAVSKERYIITTEKRPVKDDLKKVLKHKELLPFIFVWILASLGYGLNFATSIYYVMYYLERPDLISIYMLVISPAAVLSMMVVLPWSLHKFKTARKALAFSVASESLFFIPSLIWGKSNFILLCVLSFGGLMCSTMQNALVNVLVNDAIDYIQLKEGISANGLIASIKGFAQKCGNTITNSGVLLVLSLTGYVAGAIGGQNQSTMFVLNFMRFGAPVVIGLIMLFCLQFNPVDKHRDEINKMKESIAEN